MALIQSKCISAADAISELVQLIPVMCKISKFPYTQEITEWKMEGVTNSVLQAVLEFVKSSSNSNQQVPSQIAAVIEKGYRESPKDGTINYKKKDKKRTLYFDSKNYRT